MNKYVDVNKCNDILLSLNLLNEKDKNKYIKKLYSISNKVESNYHKFKIKKKSGSSRTIYEPSNTLKHIQRQILNNILSDLKPSRYATAYQKGLSVKNNALPHLNKELILKLDIKNFFDNISFYDVYINCFYYFPKNIGMLLTYLCTYYDYIPQGAPTSPYIANIVMRDFDESIGNFCAKQNIAYTRYSDDMTFSGDFKPQLIIKKVNELLKNKGLELNYQKIRVFKKSQRQEVTGIVVNEKTQVKRSIRNNIRQDLYYINKYGIDSHLERINRTDKKTYLKELYGKILYVLQINNASEEFKKYQKIINDLLYSNML